MRAPKPPARGGELSETIYGLHAGKAVFACRPQDIRSVAFERALKAELSDLLTRARAAAVPCAEVPVRELDRLAESNQHEGLVLSVAPRRWLKPKELASELVESRGIAVALDRVRNPQNIGAILRSAAFFGARAALLGAPAPHPGLPPFALRVAEGGAEHLTFSRTTDLAQSLNVLRSRGVRVIGADSHSERTLSDLRSEPPCILVLGHEREGLSPRIRACCDDCVEIRGSGAIDSLNVSVAAGVFLAAVHGSLPIRSKRATPRST
jgi:TrmH RNA methyltransferase